jgi:monovalent cation:H+ antiporter-2, CPA2 family
MVHLIEDLAILLLVSLPINLFFHKIKLPSVMGYLIAGVLIGPYGLKLISDVTSVKDLAEIGVILLLFVIGLEFSLGRLLKNLGMVMGVGGLQLGLTTAFVWFVFREMGFQQNQSIALGLIVALSSTAIVLKMITMCGSHYASSAPSCPVGGQLQRRLCACYGQVASSGGGDFFSIQVDRSEGPGLDCPGRK